jgi:hypothetical protein
LAVLAVATSSAALAAGPSGTGFATPDLIEFEQMEYVAPVASDFAPGAAGAVPLLADSVGQQRQAATFKPTSAVLKSFEGISQYDVFSYGRGFIPPNTMGAVGTTQFTEFVNGGFAVFGKNGTVQKAQSDVAFWAAAGQTGASGDSRVLFDQRSNRWVALSFGQSNSDIQIAVSNTADATGTWQSTKFTGFAGGTADYPTLAIDNNAVYIGTNNFAATTPPKTTSFRGTTLNVIPLSSLVSAGAPTTTGITTFNTPYDPYTGGRDGGFAIQGVNSTAASPDGKVVALSLFNGNAHNYDTNLTFDITNAGTAAAAKVNGQYIGGQTYNQDNFARQPNAVADTPTTGAFPDNGRVIDTLGSRISSNVYEANGLIYTVQTTSPLNDDHTSVHWQIINAATNALVSEGSIKDGVHDFFQGSLSVNAAGQVVIGYNRSGSGPDGNISVFAQVFDTVGGHLIARGRADLLKVSLVDDYHNGSLDGFVAAGRQRWGDYSQVTVDPTDPTKFWVIGEFAREYNDGTLHPNGTGGSRWSTWISEINGNTVPEPASWAMFIAGFGVIGAMQRRRRSGYATA